MTSFGDGALGLVAVPMPGAPILLASPFIGSFVGLLGDRLPRSEPVVFARSRCRACGVTLSMIDLVPVLSWAALRGRCRRCGAAIPAHLPITELGGIAVAVAAVASAPPSWMLLSALLGWVLLLLAVLDVRVHWLPLWLTVPLAASGVAVQFAVGTGIDALLGAAIGFLGLEALRQVYRRITGHDGMGGGDPILLAASGAWVGWQGVGSALLIATFGALAAAGLTATLTGRRVHHGTRVPFGAWIAVATFTVWCLGPLH